VKFLIDNQLPVTLASFFREKGFECKHVIELGLDTATDHAIWDLAVKENWIIVSKDEDFLHIAKTRPKLAQLIWVRIGNCRSATVLSVFDKLLSTIETALLAKEDIIEIR
jgi:predicted nuclease of predicted toxin-antitoxin system